jgi:diguanylate cyclase (GGDEF)-like protein
MEIVKRKNRIINTLSSVRMVSIFFSGLIFINILIENARAGGDSSSILPTIAASLLVTLFLMVLYYFWTTTVLQKMDEKYLPAYEFIDTLFFVVLFSMILLFSGGYTSVYKVLFLIIIISVTILKGSRSGMFICAVCASIILLLSFVSPLPIQSYRFLADDAIIIFIFFLTSWVLGHYVQIGNEHISELERKANIDGLTGLYNHRYFYDSLMSKIEDYRAGKCTLTLLVLDIDYFKEYNDDNGHLLGDQVLRDVATIMREKLPEHAILARYGGDEFAAILVDVSEGTAHHAAELVRKSVESLHSAVDHQQTHPLLTISIGIATCNKNIHNDVELFKCADDALYRAKLFKKNRVEIYSSILDMIQMDIGKEDIDLISSLHALINIVNAKDRYTSGHVERVVMYAKALGAKLDLNDEKKRELVLAAYMHDIGKINLSEQVLNKKNALEEDEWDQVRGHSVNGAHILKEVSVLADIAPLVLSHPDHLKGEEIPYLSRVLAVVDSFDAMTFDRPYKSGMTYDKAIKEIRANSGTQFDPEIAETFIHIIEESSKDTNRHMAEMLRTQQNHGSTQRK